MVVGGGFLASLVNDFDGVHDGRVIAEAEVFADAF